ncbi:hypothetical protein FRC08_002140 [Ceratobasidium sp. 394]|nr:hypothetical protein FRC08_002140 [Ceratobasidium sp. 394]KAG9091140.1 hypothetical protein FS749_016774 [Ceratobasidium sp. UAMH 11750]
MKATGILSVLLFAHAAFAQATDSTSAAVSTTDSASVDAATSTSSASPTASAAATSAEVLSSTSSSPSGTKTGTKSASAPDASVPAATSTSTHNSTPTGTGSSNWGGSETLSSNDGNPLIPDGISEACSTFLTKINSDTAMSGCLTPLLNAMATFTSSGSGSGSAVTKALNNLCSSNACSSSMMRSKLTDFKDACSAELTGSNPNDMVIRDYDTMYALSPFKAAICSKNPDTQAYCVLNTNSSGNSKRSVALSSDVMYARDHLTNAYVSRKRGSSQSVLVPNVDTYRNSNLLYLFISPDMNTGELCTDCTEEMMTKYVAWASAVPHALGLANSPLLGGQAQLWAAIRDKCPANFLAEISNAAGNPDAMNGASHVVAGSTVTVFAGALAALVALV